MCAKAGKAYSSVQDLLRSEFPDEPELADSYFEVHKREVISNYLWMMRTRSGVTQAEMAKRLGVSQSKIAKLEDRGDNVRMNDVVAFAHALGFSPTMQFHEGETNLASMLRLHLEAISEIMSELERLAAGDKDITFGAFEHFAKETKNMLDDVLPKWAVRLNDLKAESMPVSEPKKQKLNVEIHTKDLASFIGSEEKS